MKLYYYNYAPMKIKKINKSKDFLRTYKRCSGYLFKKLIILKIVFKNPTKNNYFQTCFLKTKDCFWGGGK